MWVRRATVAVVVSALAMPIAIAACTNDDTAVAPQSASNSPPTQASTASDAPAVAESDFCATFDSLALERDGRGGEVMSRDEAGWDHFIATVEHIDSVAPAEIKPEADAYVQMAKDRKELAAANDWADVSELPSEVRDAFISTHAALQQQVNQLLAYAKTNCNGFN